MNILDYVIGGVIILFSIIIIAVVLLQEGRQANLGSISGSDSFMDKGRGRTLDVLLSRWTKVLAVAFFVVVLLGMVITRYL